MHAKQVSDKDFLPYTNSYHQKAPYLVWDDRRTSHRKQKKICGFSSWRNEKCKCCESTSVVIAVVSLVVIAMFAIISFSAYLGVITRLFPKPILVLHGNLLVKKGDVFSSELLSKSSEEFIAKASKYEQLLNSIYEESDLKQSVADIKVHGFKHGSLLVYFRLYLDQDQFSSITINEVSEKARLILERGLQNIELNNNQQIDITLLEMSGYYTSTNANSSSTESNLFGYNSYLNSTESTDITFDKTAFNYTTMQTEFETTEDITTHTDKITTVENTPITQNTELKISDIHQSTDRPFALSYGPWVPFIPTSNPIPTDRIITVPYSTVSRPKEPNISFIGRVDDEEEEDLLEERYLKQSPDTNATNVLVKLLSKTQLKPPHSFGPSVLLSLTSQNMSESQKIRSNVSTESKRMNLSNSNLSVKFSDVLTDQPNNKEQAWIPIIITPAAPSNGNHMRKNITANKANKNHRKINESAEEHSVKIATDVGYQFSETPKQSDRIFSKTDNHDFPDTSLKIPLLTAGNNGWHGYYPLHRSDLGYISSYKESTLLASPPAGRTGAGEAYAFPVDDHRYVGDTGVIPLTPPSTTELTVGASLYINQRRKQNQPPFSSYGNLRRKLPTSLSPRTKNQEISNVDIYSPPLVKKQSNFPLAVDDAFSTNRRNYSEVSSLPYGSTITSINHPLYVREANRSYDGKNAKDFSDSKTIESSTVPSASKFRTDRIGFAKIIPSDKPNKQQLPSTKDTATETKGSVQNKEDYIVPLISTRNGNDSSKISNSHTTTSLQEHVIVHLSAPEPDGVVKNLTNIKNQKVTIPGEQIKLLSASEACPSEEGFRCGNQCAPWKVRCNRKFDCEDKADEMNCSCAEYFWSQRYNRKICDGIIDCWDQTDETGCPWCSSEKFICPNTKRCIDINQVCDGVENCPFGIDEQHCITLVYNTSDVDNHYYRSSGYVALRKNGLWGMLCTETSREETAGTKYDIEKIGQSVCQTLSYRTVLSVKKDANHELKAPRYYQLQYNNPVLRTNHHIQQVECHTKKLMQITCKSLECGIRSLPLSNRSRIVGGQSSISGSWPWQVALYKEGNFQCGAVLISDQWLITAAHCFFYSKTAYWTARLGLLRRGTELPSPYEKIYTISHIFINPNYEEKGYLNDIALLRMNAAVSFSDYIRPVCLPEPHEDIKLWHNQLCTVVGWGKLFETGRLFPDTLQEVWLPVFDTEECRKRTIFLPLYKITDEMFCAGYERGGRDACLGDSGGPLVCQRPNGKWTVVGVTSNGDGCGRPGRPGVYTKVTSFLNWMNPILGSIPKPSDVASCNGHRCQLGQCIAQYKVCDGMMDCWNGSDEQFCSVKR